MHHENRDQKAELDENGYVAHLDIRFSRANAPALVDAVTDRWFSERLCCVKGSVARFGEVHGEYHWHSHDHDDEFMFALEGEFLIEFHDRTISLAANRGLVVPKGTVHRARPLERDRASTHRRPSRLMTLRASASNLAPDWA
jgi:mannose-6-phosphate isomerase-like protein (cupin superfamily)